jgi:hypothetical protein
VLPIYDAISYENRIVKGGRTRPIIVTVRDEQKQLKQYVVKLYSKKEVEQNQTVAREVITMALAKEFDLCFPSPAFIRLSNTFSQTLPTELRTEIKGKDSRLKFGCEYIPDALNYGVNLPKNTLEGLLRIDTIFAFDNLVRNFDRRTEKTNLLLLNHDIYLIDHEYCLSIETKHITDLEIHNWNYNYKNHVFFSFLSGHARKTKEQYFDEFDEYLKHLDIRTLRPYVSQLEHLDFPTPDMEILEYYLLNTRKNSHKFVTLLKGLLQ